jgi:Family of unknown function (DUF6308)
VREPEIALRIERLDGELLVLDGLGLARAFFAGDSGEDSFDSLAGTGNPNRIELDDILVLNRTARARSPHGVWAPLLEASTPWLAAIDPELDLLAADNGEWASAGGDALVAAALRATIGPGRGMAVATKLLHLKRPRLFPMLDRLVAEMLGAAPTGADERRVATAFALTGSIRSQGRRNLDALRAIEGRLAEAGTRCSLVRILDAVVWMSHPLGRIEGAPRVLSAGMRRD